VPRRLHRVSGSFRRSVRPLRQGELDGLCGVYSVINAVRLLCPEINQADLPALFRTLIRTLSRRRIRLTDAVALGLEIRTVRALANSACDYINDELQIRLKARRPHKPRRAYRLNRFWHWLQAELSKGNILIVGVSGKLAHWTVVYRITDKSAHLADSDGLKTLLRSRCTLRATRSLYQLRPEDVIILSRREARWHGNSR
jgi:hypothetical protein